MTTLAPGVKVRLLSGPLELAVLPSVAIGIITLTPNAGPPDDSRKLWDVLAGLRLFLSHQSGAYAAVAYQLLYLSRTEPSIGGGSAMVQTAIAHTLLASLGYRFAPGAALV